MKRNYEREAYKVKQSMLESATGFALDEIVATSSDELENLTVGSIESVEIWSAVHSRKDHSRRVENVEFFVRVDSIGNQSDTAE